MNLFKSLFGNSKEKKIQEINKKVEIQVGLVFMNLNTKIVEVSELIDLYEETYRAIPTPRELSYSLIKISIKELVKEYPEEMNSNKQILSTLNAGVALIKRTLIPLYEVYKEAEKRR